MTGNPSRFTLRRQELKKETAEYYGVPITSIKEVRVLVPESRVSDVIKYARRKTK